MDWYLIAEQSGLMGALQGLGSTLWLIASVGVTLGFVIFVHELGHFLAAKACGVKCEKFYIGFDVPMGIGPLKLPATLFRWQWGETEYGIGSLPLGGYVKMLGQDDNPSAQVRENERIKLRKSDDPTAANSAVNDSDSQTSTDSTTADGSDDDFILDPRSYPAKPVWQRMIIISAGVVMNLIFAVVFASSAYLMGVNYIPCVVGDTVAASPAWEMGLDSQDQILQIGRRWSPDEHLRFRRDLMPQVLLNGGETPLDLLVRRDGEEVAEWISVQPVNRRKQAKKILEKAIAESGGSQAMTDRQKKVLEMLPGSASLGVTSVNVAKLSSIMPAETDEAYELLKSGDQIIGVDDVAFEADPETGKILTTKLESYLAQHVDQSVALKVRRPIVPKEGTESQSDEIRYEDVEPVTLPPCRMRMLGMTMRVGPIDSVRHGTPADQAGLRAGDRLVSINGEDIGDVFTLQQRMLALAGEEIEVVYQRDEKEQSLKLIPTLPESYGEELFYGAMLPIGSLGIALPVQNVVETIDADGPAANAEIQPGDEIGVVQLVLEDEEALEKAKKMFPGYNEPIYLDRHLPCWQYVHTIMQMTVPGTSLKLSVARDDSGEMESFTVKPVESDQWYCSSRGLLFTGLTRTRTAQSWSEAGYLGFRETVDSVNQVFRVLHGLLTGKVSWRMLGGPITIARAAGYEASEGFSQLLIFLTLLSANLAVLNFLPIPALDGGHMVFLAAEGVRGKPVDERFQVLLTVIGVVFLLSLIVILSIKDVGSWLQLFG